MYNAQLHHKRQQASTLAMHHDLQASKQVSRSLLVRSQLAANYNRRIDHFIYAMLNDPIRVKVYVRPLQVAGRMCQPEKYVGPPAMMYRNRKPEQSRLRKRVESELPADSSMSSSESRYYPKEKPGPPPKPAAILVDLDRKTHFKAVMTKLIREKKQEGLSEPTVMQRTKTAAIVYAHSKALNQFTTAGMMAKDALETCQVIPKGIKDRYLRVGEGRLTSNPFTPINQLYSQLYSSQSFTCL